ncbi:Morphology and auto-aggregation control protein [Pseudomonas sp. 22 E 5]|jgi:DNA-binding transcriptional LysR family regulator|uniref:LysR substrate-binding domain-containing protein n=1 Tax=Pseudomonas canadensis TaxID=915099 RepID=A0ABZ1A537_9PSED|nr:MULTISPECIES: LysR substrate-binding domain-containing protein [Pseudomonas]CRM97460.1 Morphology and auto-aggregation control protein [Pseudomonas sp. 22 E 5]MCF5168010.1 LysR family transcriptional regulator [Pseudomonas canadensis]PJK36025.1 LysR family transcriptional regulator [Pseudomonas sp. S09F 262]PJK39968.1 LysR family transcriptional regulator [Pseudomonas sp. S10E 269]WRI24507.1 LysR substrate-binding domain-containing protein [Pseudomonas canadensis]
MDVRFLRSLVAVIEAGSIAAAARRENRTAAAISQRIKALERTLGCTLLMRSAHGACASDQCLLLLPKIQAVIEQARELQEDLSQDGLSGEIKIGAISTALTGVLPEAIERMALSAPRLRLKITPGDSRSLYERLLTQELDAVILVRPPFQPPKALTATLLRVEPLILIAPTEWGTRTLEALLREQSLIRYDARSWGGQIAQRYLEDQSFDPQVLCELDALETIAILVAQGMGVSLVPQWAGMSCSGLSVLPVDDAPRYARDLVVMHSSTPRRPVAMRHLLEHLCRASMDKRVV